MHIEALYYTVVMLVFLSGIYFTCKGFCINQSMMPVRYRAGLVYRLSRLQRALTDSKQDQIFEAVGISLSMNKYQAWRKLVISLLLIVAATKLFHGDLYEVRKYLSISVIIFVLSYPKNTFRGKRTPFNHIMSIMKKRKAEAMDEELTGIIIQMKNIIISSNQETSANYIFMRLIPFTKLTKKAFSLALMYIRQGEIQRAGEVFKIAFDTKLGTMFSSILIKLEELPAREFLEQLDMAGKKAEAEHRTRRETAKVRVNTIRRLFAIVEAVLIMGNFVYLILIDTLLMMNF